MRGRISCAIGALGVAFALVGASRAAPTDDEAAALKRASARGALLYAYDQAAWVSTDELLRQVPDPRTLGVRGWIVEERTDALRAIYYKLDNGQPSPVFTADVKGKTIIASHVYAAGEDASLTPIELRMIKARGVAIEHRGPPCAAGSPNLVVLPPHSADDPIPVYILSPQAKTGEYPAGGHYEVDVAPDGSVASSRSFTKSCLVLSTAPGPGGAKSVGMALTHLLDTRPTEIHVYLSLWTGMPLFVVTPTTLPPDPDHYRSWMVTGTKIAEVKNGGK